MPSKFVAIFLLMAIVFSSGCVSETGPNPGDVSNGDKSVRTAADGDTVRVWYEGTFEDGTVFDSTESHGGEPIEFVVGSGQMISGFDNAVVGMVPGEEKTVTLEPSEAYGEYDEMLVLEMPAEQAPNASVGDVLGLSMGGGQAFPARVLAVNEENITLDLNHEMAGKTLIFRMRLVEITE